MHYKLIFMKSFFKSLACAAAFLCALCAGAADLKIDASSNEKLQESFFNVLMSLDDSSQQKFASAMATLGVVMTQNYSEAEGHKKFQELVNGKTADEIISLSKQMGPKLKELSNTINGKTSADFNKTVSQVLISLPLHKQTQFSEALAAIFYDAKQNNVSDADMMKKLDGKTADDVIGLATGVKTAFPAPEKELTVAPLSQEDLKKSGITDKKSAPSAAKSLVPAP